MTAPNTLFLRLSGPMQSWGTGSRLQIRRTDPYPSKSGVLGMILCAMGVSRPKAPEALGPLVSLAMGVRIDRPGAPDWDYHTAGAGIGIRQAKGGIKYTATTGEPETLLSRREYLLDASFLVTLQGNATVIRQAKDALESPAWPVFLGRKCCIPTEPVLAGIGDYGDLQQALESQPYYSDQPFADGATLAVDAVLEHSPGKAPPADARLVHDVPRTLQYPSHGARWVVPCKVTAPVARTPRIACAHQGRAGVDYTSEQWKAIRRQRLEFDNGLCVFCKSAAEEVHHVTYENAGRERIEDLRSLCRLCHDACTQLEYGNDMRETRVDPADPAQRELILRQISLLLTSRRLGRRRAILENTRATDFLADAPQ
jgi:CRISPR system Cascade subunit CasD